MTTAEYLATIDPIASNWSKTGTAKWTNSATGQIVSSSDVIQANINAYNKAAKEAGKPLFIPGITPMPDEIKYGGKPPAGDPPVDDDGNKIPPSKPGPTTGGPPPPGSVGVTGTPGYGGYILGSTWNPVGAPGAGGGPGGAGPGIGGPMQWQENAGSGSPNPHTGTAMEFKPWGVKQALSSEILRYGGMPNSGAGGKWTGSNEMPEMIDMFTPQANSGRTSAGVLDPPYAQGGSDPGGSSTNPRTGNGFPNGGGTVDMDGFDGTPSGAGRPGGDAGTGGFGRPGGGGGKGQRPVAQPTAEELAAMGLTPAEWSALDMYAQAQILRGGAPPPASAPAPVPPGAGGRDYGSYGRSNF